MKADIHPQYREVVIRDTTAGTTVLTRSTTNTNKTIVWEDGNTYPVIDIEISSHTHPFYTGKQRIVDTAGRVDRFNQRRTAGEKAQKVAKSAATKRAKKDDRPVVPELTPAEIAPAGNAPQNANETESATSTNEVV